MQSDSAARREGWATECTVGQMRTHQRKESSRWGEEREREG